MMKEDVLPAADRSRLRGVRRLNYGERGGGEAVGKWREMFNDE